VQPELILSAMLALPQFSEDRSDTAEQRRELYLPIATAIAAVARTNEDAAFLIAQAWHESRFARAVLTGHCELMPKGMQCDPDKHGVPRARGSWQVWHFCKATTVEGEAKCVLSTAHLGLARCASWGGAFYALTGHGACGERPERVATMRRILEKWGAT
jgi:hypothetical protein